MGRFANQEDVLGLKSLNRLVALSYIVFPDRQRRMNTEEWDQQLANFNDWLTPDKFVQRKPAGASLKRGAKALAISDPPIAAIEDGSPEPEPKEESKKERLFKGVAKAS